MLLIFVLGVLRELLSWGLAERTYDLTLLLWVNVLKLLVLGFKSIALLLNLFLVEFLLVF